MATAPQAARPAATHFGTASHRPKMPPQISSVVDTIISPGRRASTTPAIAKRARAPSSLKRESCSPREKPAQAELGRGTLESKW